MSTTDSETIQFIAKQLLEVNEKLTVLVHLSDDVAAINRSLLMVKGWMDGQEEITKRHSERTANVYDRVNTVAGHVVELRQRVDKAFDVVVDMDQKLSGTLELAKTAFELATDAHAKINKIPGGEHEHSNEHAASQ